ncbi:hypothetical protein FJ365_00425 [Candidatus Dependentiae bacterium]|nr:hypothetical protein [Candidatus Dependentiae bacterium]
MVRFQELKYVVLMGVITIAPTILRGAGNPLPNPMPSPTLNPIVERLVNTTTTAIATASTKVTDAATNIVTTAPKELAATFNALRDSMYNLFSSTTDCLKDMGLRMQSTSSWIPQLLTPCAEQQASSFRALAADPIAIDTCASKAYTALAESISQANTYVQEAITRPSSIWASSSCLKDPSCVETLFNQAADPTPEGQAARDFLKTAFNELVRIKTAFAEKLYTNADAATRSCADGYLARINTVTQEKLNEVQAFLNPEYVCESVCSNTRAAASWLSATCGSISAYLAAIDPNTWKIVGTITALYLTVKFGPRLCRNLLSRCRRQQAQLPGQLNPFVMQEEAMAEANPFAQ